VTMTPRHLATLAACCSGGVPRGRAIEALGIAWYGDLLCLLRRVGLLVLQLPPEYLAVMDEAAERLLGSAPAERTGR